jgi:hypothetical protein
MFMHHSFSVAIQRFGAPFGVLAASVNSHA